jgi:MFS family permease
MTTSPPSEGLLTPRYRARTFGIVLTVGLVALESLGVATILPDVARQLGGLGSYGWGMAALMLTNIIGTVLAGHTSDRRGPTPALAAGLIAFALGSTVAGVAPSWPLFLCGRLIQGLGVGAVMAMAYAVIGLVYPEHLRARMFALLSSAWTLPSLIGPVAASSLAGAIGWRWVFLFMLPLTAIAAMTSMPGLPKPAVPVGRWNPGPLLSSVALAAGSGLLLAALGLQRVALIVPLATAGTLVAVVALRQVTPPGTLSVRRGVPSGVVVRFLLCGVYFGTEAFLPLGLRELRDVSTFEAGLGLSAGALTWVAGSALQAKWDRGRRAAVSVGFAVLVVGVAVLAFGVLVGPGLLAVLGWVIGGVGMGIAFNAATAETLGSTPQEQQGSVSAALQLAQTLATAIASGLGGAVIAHRGPAPSAFLGIFAGTAALALAGIVTAWRITRPTLVNRPSD